MYSLTRVRPARGPTGPRGDAPSRTFQVGGILEDPGLVAAGVPAPVGGKKDSTFSPSFVSLPGGRMAKVGDVAVFPSTNGEGSLINITVGWVRFARNGFCRNLFHPVGRRAPCGRSVTLGGQGWIALDEICILRLLISSFRSNPRSSPHYLRAPMLPGAPFGSLAFSNFSFVAPLEDVL